MALSAIQALYDDDNDDDNDEIRAKNNEEEIEDRMAVLNDPAFSVMSKIKLNLTPAIAIQVNRLDEENTSFCCSLRSIKICPN